jgi:hypothetical protein
LTKGLFQRDIFENKVYFRTGKENENGSIKDYFIVGSFGGNCHVWYGHPDFIKKGWKVSEYPRERKQVSEKEWYLLFANAGQAGTGQSPEKSSVRQTHVCS